MNQKIMMIALICCAAFFVSCTTDYDLQVKDYDTALTLYNKNADFASYKYFLMPDTIMHILPEGGTDDISRKYDAVVKQNVISNFESRGYQHITLAETAATPADFVVVLTAYSSTYVGYYYDYWSYWGWYYPYYPPGWGYYPPGGAMYSYTTGTLVVSMIDPILNDPAGQKVMPVWWGHITGLLGDTYSSSQTRILNALNALYAQSPYLVSGQ